MFKKNKITFSKILTALSKLLFVYLFLIFYILFGTFLVHDLFFNKRCETLNLTYYGFAVFAALANICFSYSKTYGNDDRNQVHIKELGERFLYSSIGFLIGSIFNYLTVNSVTLFKVFKFQSAIAVSTQICGYIFFSSAFSFGCYAMHLLLKHLTRNITHIYDKE